MAHLIHDDDGNAAALADLDALLDAAPTPGTPQADELQLLALVIEMYEKHRWPFELPDPVDAILLSWTSAASRGATWRSTSAAVRACRRCSHASAG